MPSFPVRMYAIGSPEGPLTIPEFFNGADPLKIVGDEIGKRGTLNFDFMTLEAPERPAPFRLDERLSRKITKKEFNGIEYPVVEISFGGPAPAPAPAPPAAPANPCDAILREAGIVGLTPDEARSKFRHWALRNHPDKGGVEARFKEVSACMDTQYGSARTRRRKGRKRTRRRRMTRRR